MVGFLKSRGFELVRVRGSHHVLGKGELRTVAEVARGIACGPKLRVRGERG